MALSDVQIAKTLFHFPIDGLGMARASVGRENAANPFAIGDRSASALCAPDPGRREKFVAPSKKTRTESCGKINDSAISVTH